ncbi:hypothetical protein ES705_44391 [subsurface metagenome]
MSPPRGGISERFMEFIRGRVIEAGIDTYTEDAMPVPTSRTEELAMLIHKVMVNVATPTMQAASVTLSSWHVADRSYVSTRDRSYPGILAYGSREANDLPAGLFSYPGDRPQFVYDFDPPILYAKALIYLGFASEGEAAPQWCKVAIGYTLERVSKDAFIAALIE